MNWVERITFGLRVMAQGMGGIFFVILVLIVGTMVLKKIFTKG